MSSKFPKCPEIKIAGLFDLDKFSNISLPEILIWEEGNLFKRNLCKKIYYEQVKA